MWGLILWPQPRTLGPRREWGDARVRRVMKTGGSGVDAAKNDPAAARHRERVRQWACLQRAYGRCRCGKRIAAGSVSRCLVCLERRRREERQKRGIRTAGRRRVGRPMIGPVGERRREFERDEHRREWRRERQAERRLQRWRRRYW